MSRTVKLQIEGMHCASCEKIITKELQEVPGVESIKIDSQTGRGAFIAGEEAGDEQIIAAVRRAGYQGRIAGR